MSNNVDVEAIKSMESNQRGIVLNEFEAKLLLDILVPMHNNFSVQGIPEDNLGLRILAQGVIDVIDKLMTEFNITLPPTRLTPPH